MPQSENTEQPDANALRERVTALLASGIAQNALARSCGVSDSALSQWLRGVYKGNDSSIETKVARYLSNLDYAQANNETIVAPPPFFETQTSQTIWPDLRYIQLRGGFGLIVGGAGLGKTTTAREYAARHPNVWIVTMSPATGSVQATLLAIADRIGIAVVSRSKADLERAIIERLGRSQGLLIIDQGQYLDTATLYQLLSIREKSAEREELAAVGIVIMGNEQIYSRIKSGYAQLYSRLGKRIELTRPRVADLDAAITAWTAALGIQPTAPLKTFCRKVGARAGYLRNLHETFTLAAFLAAGAGEPVDAETLEDAWNSLGGDAR